MPDIKQIQVNNTNYNISGAAVVLEDNNTTVNGQWKAKTNQITSLVDGQMFLYRIVKSLDDNNEATLTITANGVSLGAVKIIGYLMNYQEVGISYNCMPGEFLLLIYNATESKFQILNGTSSEIGNISKILYSGGSYSPRIEMMDEQLDIKVESLELSMYESSYGDYFHFGFGSYGRFDITDVNGAPELYLEDEDSTTLEIFPEKMTFEKMIFTADNTRFHIGAEQNGHSTKIWIYSDAGYDYDFYIKAISSPSYSGLYLNRPIYICDPNEGPGESTQGNQRVLIESDITEISESVGNNLKVNTDEWESFSNEKLDTTIIIGSEVWTDGTNIYYSNGISNQYILNKSTSAWTTKTWSGTASFTGSNIWTDGTDIYYSGNTTHYVLNKSTSTWSNKTWSGLTNFYGSRIWTDGENIYYSNGISNQYILNKSTSTWTVKTWTGLTNFYGSNVWTDGTDIYYSSGSTQYVLNKSVSTWTTKTWIGLTSFYGVYIWIDGTNIYYSTGLTQYMLNKSTSTWTVKTWTGLTSFTGSNVWTDGTDIYYSSGSTRYVLNKATSTWSQKIIKLSIYSYELWTDGNNIYSSYDGQYVLNIKTSLWENKTWSGYNDIEGQHIWTDGDNIYYSHDDDHYVLNQSASTWTAKSWSGLTNFNGEYVWTDGDNIYYSYGSDRQYILDKASSTWIAKTWSGLTDFDGRYIWTEGDNIYYSDGTDQYVLNKYNSTWLTKTWAGLTSFEGDCIWTDGNNIYYSSGSTQKMLNKSTSTWIDQTWTELTNFDGDNIFRLKDLVIYSDGPNDDYNRFSIKTMPLSQKTDEIEKKLSDKFAIANGVLEIN